MRNKMRLPIFIFILVATFAVLISTISYIIKLETQLEVRGNQIKELTFSNKIVNDFFEKEVDSISNNVTYKLKEEYLNNTRHSELWITDVSSQTAKRSSVQELSEECNRLYNENNVLNTVLVNLKKHVDFEYSVEKIDDENKITISIIDYNNLITQYSDNIDVYQQLVDEYKKMVDGFSKELQKANAERTALHLIMERTGATYSVEDIDGEPAVIVKYKNPDSEIDVLKSVLTSIENNFGITYTTEQIDGAIVIELKQHTVK